MYHVFKDQSSSMALSLYICVGSILVFELYCRLVNAICSYFITFTIVLLQVSPFLAHVK